jgi:hypothetical protein
MSDAIFSVGDLPWRDMGDAPQNGEIIAVCFREWNRPENPLRIQFSQWIGDGRGGKWCQPWNPGSETYADGWLPLSAFNIHTEAFG